MGTCIIHQAVRDEITALAITAITTIGITATRTVQTQAVTIITALVQLVVRCKTTTIPTALWFRAIIRKLSPRRDQCCRTSPCFSLTCTSLSFNNKSPTRSETVECLDARQSTHSQIDVWRTDEIVISKPQRLKRNGNK